MPTTVARQITFDRHTPPADATPDTPWTHDAGVRRDVEAVPLRTLIEDLGNAGIEQVEVREKGFAVRHWTQLNTQTGVEAQETTHVTASQALTHRLLRMGDQFMLRRFQAHLPVANASDLEAAYAAAGRPVPPLPPRTRHVEVTPLEFALEATDAPPVLNAAPPRNGRRTSMRA